MPRNPGGVHYPVYEIRDPIYGFVKLTGAEVDIINTPTFQRLRDIRQLAMGHMVYPGANHTRFEHSLGCVHMATQMLDLLQERETQPGHPTFHDAFHADEGDYRRLKKLLRLASLLHDLGHPPFSHSGEEILPTGISHEMMTAELLRNTEIANKIQKYYTDASGITIEDVIAVATNPEYAKNIQARTSRTNFFLNAILTGELGADRIDYLLRDAHHSGQVSGQFDYLKLLNALSLVPQPEGEGADFVLGLDEGGWLVAEQMVVARYLMYVSLYFHKTKRIYEIHLEDFMREWLPDGKLPSNPQEYAEWTDSRVLAAIFDAARSEAAAGHLHAVRFVKRSHLRLAKELVLADNYSKVGGRRVPDRERFDKLAEEVRIKFGTEGVVVDQPSREATGMFEKDSRILVLWEKKPRYLDEISEVVRGISAKIWRGRVYCEKGNEKDVREVCAEFLSQNPLSEEPNVESANSS